MSEANYKISEYIMTCIDGTAFKVPFDAAVWSDEKQAVTIGGIEVDAIYRDPGLMPGEFWKFKEVREVSEVSEADEVPPGKSLFYPLAIYAASELLPPLKTEVIGGDGEGWDFVERYGSDIDWGWQNYEGAFRSKGSISHWFYCPKVSEVREVSEV